MPRKGHSEEKIVYALRQVEAGKKVSEICREMGVSAQAFYSWEAAIRWVGLGRVAGASPTARRKPEAENTGGGLDVGQTHFAGSALKKSLKPGARRELVRRIREAYRLNERRACGLVGITRWSNRYESRCDPQEELRMRLKELAGSRTRYGYRRLTVMLRREGWKVNTKRVYRIYHEEQLQLRTAKRAKRAAHARVPLPQPAWPNQRWSMDFVNDRFADGRWFRILTVVDQYTRECLCAHADRAQTGEKAVEQMKNLVDSRGVPESITTDNGGEFAGKATETWAYENQVKLDLIRPGKPVENGYIESFNGRLRDECLNGEIFFGMADAREKLEHWRLDYNETRPHSSLDDRTPAEFAKVARRRPFTLPTVDKAGPRPCQGSAVAGQKTPALDTARSRL
jgi:putative transposase